MQGSVDVIWTHSSGPPAFRCTSCRSLTRESSSGGRRDTDPKERACVDAWRSFHLWTAEVPSLFTSLSFCSMAWTERVLRLVLWSHGAIAATLAKANLCRRKSSSSLQVSLCVLLTGGTPVVSNGKEDESDSVVAVLQALASLASASL